MARFGYRLAVALVFLMFCAVVLIQYALLMRLHSRTYVERGLDNWFDELKVPVITANPTEAKSDSITSRGLPSRAQTPSRGFVRLAETSYKAPVISVDDRGTSEEPHVSYSEQEAKEGTTRMDLSNFEVVRVNNELKVVRKDLGANVALERSGLTPRPLSIFEAAGGNILFTIRTTHLYHHKRLPVLFQTWLSSTGHSKVVLVTDGPDSIIENRTRELGIEYVIAEACKSGHSQLCCKAGEELGIAFREKNQHIDWLCHVDDDMYVLQSPLVNLLGHFHPRTDPVYIGRAGTDWDSPYRVRMGSSLGTPGTSYHFAVGGMYCLSRAMLTRLQPYLGNGQAFSDSCLKALEPEDVTLGLVIGAVLKLTLRWTNLIHTHGLHLSTQVDPQTLGKQVAVSYGFGSTQWGNIKYNAICVPGSLYAVIEDETQFKSLHCMLHPETDWCVKRKAWLEAHMGGRTRSDRCKGW